MRSISIQDCSNIEMSKLKTLKSLTIYYPLINNYHWLKELKSLQDFYLNTCSNKEPEELKGIENIFNCDKLQHISLSSRIIKNIPYGNFFNNLSYAWLDLANLEKLASPSSNAIYLKQLNIQSYKNNDFSFLDKMTYLEKLSINSSNLVDLSFISKMKKINSLKIRNSGVSDISALKNSKSLREIDISQTNVKDISALSNLNYIERFDAENCKIESYEPLRNLQLISWMYLSPPLNKDISPFEGKKYLNTLSLSKGKVKNINALFPLILKGNLKSLFMHGLEVEELPDGLEFERYEFIENLKKYVKKNPDFIEDL